MATGIAHRPMNYKDYRITDGLVFRLDLECEQARTNVYLPFVRKFGYEFKDELHDGKTPVFGSGARCFDAAFRVAMMHGLVYCEGIVLIKHGDSVLPVGHGWCVTRGGFVVDPTMSKVQGSGLAQYLGVPIKLGYALEWANKAGYLGILDGYPNGDLSPIYSDPVEVWREFVNVSK